MSRSYRGREWGISVTVWLECVYPQSVGVFTVTSLGHI